MLGAEGQSIANHLAKRAEFFGLWGLIFKLAAVITLPFGWAKDAWGTPAALWVLLGFILIGFILTLFINEQRGLAAARHLGRSQTRQRHRRAHPLPQLPAARVGPRCHRQRSRSAWRAASSP